MGCRLIEYVQENLLSIPPLCAHFLKHWKIPRRPGQVFHQGISGAGLCRLSVVSAACISCCTSFDRAIWDIIASPAEGKRDNKKTVGFQVRGRVHNDKVMTLESGEALLNSPDR
jgi:hypothetical protein